MALPDERLVYSVTTGLSLQQQLLARVATFQKNLPNITQSEIARYCNIGESNFDAALAGRRGLSANSCLQLHTLLSLPPHEVTKKFSQPVRSSKILNLQQSVQGQPARMRLDNDGWVSGQSGVDPSNSTTVDDTADANVSTAATATVLRQVPSLHRKAIKAINGWLLSQKVNQGSTALTSQRFSARRILKSIRFARADDSDDTTAATQDLLDTLGTLDVPTRLRVVGAILQAFPQFTRT